MRSTTIVNIPPAHPPARHLAARRTASLVAALLLAGALLGCTLFVPVTPATPPAGGPSATAPAVTRSPAASLTPPATTAPATPPASPGTPTAAPSTTLPGTTLPGTTLPGTATPGAPSSTPLSGTAAPADLYLTAADVRLYPGPEQYSGDQVTLQVLGHRADRVAPNPIDVVAYLEADGTRRELARGTLGGVNLSGEAQGIFERAWDTSGLSGPVTLTVQLDPADRLTVGDEDASNNTASLSLIVRPAAERPASELGARWVTTSTLCCVIHYVTGTAAERDLAQIMAEAQQAVDFAAERLGVTRRDTLQFYFLSKVVGHGGFAGGEITISYLDRNYPSGDLTQVLRHESTHVLDQQLTDQRTQMMAEGLAVYIAGGHFKPEPIDQRAAELVRQGRYIPLRQLADNFYPAQHETAYLEGAAFISYLVGRYGWEDFTRFYAVSGHANGDDSTRIDAGLRQVYGVGLDEAESAWLAQLEALPPDAAAARDLADTLRFFDDVRAYQQAYDPTAYFLYAWLPSMPSLEQNGDIADALRHPRAPENIALETMLIDANQAIAARDFPRSEALLGGVEAVVQAHNFAGQALAGQYLAVVQAVAAQGFEAQRVSVAADGRSAQVWAVPAGVPGPWPALTVLTVENGAQGWQVAR